MTEQDLSEEEANVAEPAATSAPKKAANPVRVWTLILLGVVLVLTLVYLRADRITPYTSQARVHALVIPIAPEVSGTVTSVGVSNNQQVEAEQILFQIDTERYQLAVQNAEANLQAARQTIGASTAGVDAARAQVEIAEANETRARQDAVRLRRIRQEDPGAISERRLEVAEASLASAEASVAAAGANVQRAIEDLGDSGEDNTRIQQATAALEQSRIDMARASVRAPEDGLVTGVRLDRGNFAAAGAPQMTFIAIDNIWVQADFTENNLGNVSAGDRVDLVFDALPGQIVQGTIRETGFGVAVDSAALGSLPTIQNNRQWLRSAQRFPVLIDFDISDPQLRRTLRVGSQVSAVIYTGDHGLFNWLGGVYINLVSILTYAF
ncbi:MAG: biotin/lipoyl-binding protein [Pseudomonadales bacterium]|nr:biotin/lipoyl-binding protein [Pseudomonadales bacterium]